ncbi:MAG: AI-2E family transporter [Acidobacteriota bacterium]|nr:AI-2E family transporter [Acidobacteriota bacterium]
MNPEDHLRRIGEALRAWLVARTYDSLVVGAAWWAGLRLLHVPLALLWAVLAALLQFVPHIGPVVALVGPAVAAAVSGGEDRFFLVLALFGGITILNGLVIEPLFFKRVARIPIWASLLAPIVLGLAFSFWGVILAAPLLAIYYSFQPRPARSMRNGSKLSG